MKVPILSFSSINKFKCCPRWLYLYKINPIPFKSDFTFAEGGKCVHETLEKYYNEKKDNDNILSDDVLREYFEERWINYKLHKGFLDSRKELYWEMVLRGKNKNLKLTSIGVFNGERVNLNANEKQQMVLVDH